MFFKGASSGTQYVLFILLGIVVISLLGIQTIKIIDKYVLRLLLGKYDFYVSINKRISRLDEKLKIK